MTYIQERRDKKLVSLDTRDYKVINTMPKKKKIVLKRRKKLIPLPTLKRKAEKIVNQYIRNRDSEDGYFTCISCGKTKPVASMNAGHYVPVGRCSFLRFEEHNINGECQDCNHFDKFHLIGYRKNLIEKIGLDAVKWLEENRFTKHKHSRQELEEIIEKYKN